MEYVLVLADIIKAKDIGASKSKDYYRSARHKYEKGKLDKYKSACLCTIEHPINELLPINELVRVGAIKLADRVGAITPMNWYAIKLADQ